MSFRQYLLVSVLIIQAFLGLNAQAADSRDVIGVIREIIRQPDPRDDWRREEERRDRDRDRWRRPPAVTCDARDRGYEEHWGGHGSCGECLSRHGECIETCSEILTVCEAEGRDRTGYVRAFRGQGRDRWEAERDALDTCYYRGFDYCRVTRCQNEQQIISRRDCR